MLVGVALPDEVDVPGGQVDGFLREDALSQVHEYAVTCLDGIIETDQGHLGSMGP